MNQEVLLVALHNRDRKYVSSKPLYYLTLGPDVFAAIMQSYDKSMLRKRTQSSIDPSIHYLGE